MCTRCKAQADALYKLIDAGRDDGHDHAAVAFAVSAPFLRARELVEKERAIVEKQQALEANDLPAAKWIDEVPGFGIGSLAAIVGECGDLSNYSTVSKLWKRMGVGVINGQRQRRVQGAEAMLHGYNPSRRSVSWNIGNSVLRKQSARKDKTTGEVTQPAGPYRLLYDRRKAYEQAKPEAQEMVPLHIHRRATRIVEKELLKRLWLAWRRFS